MQADLGTFGLLTAGTRILRADNGAEIAIGELMRSGERPMVWSLDGRRRLVARLAGDVILAGQQEVFTLRLASGREVEVAASASLLTLGGWTPLSGLGVGARVAVPRRVPEPVTMHRMADDEVILLAHMIGDGSCVKRQPIRYASIDEQSLVAVTNAAKHFGVTAKRDDYPAARVTTLRLPSPYHLTHGKRNPIAAWLDGMGLFGKRSYEKFVPATVFGAPNDQVALFMRHLWSTDGCVKWDAKGKQGRIYYASTSRRLADDVSQLLLRLGVLSRLYRVPQGTYRDIFHLYISGAPSQATFVRDIDVHGAKFFAAREVLANLTVVQSNENVDTVPQEVWDRVREALTEQGMTHRAFAAAMQTKFCGSAMWKHSPSRDRLHRAAAVLGDRGLHDLTNDDVFWDKIVEVTSIGEREVFALAVAATQNVVAQGILLSSAPHRD